MRIISGKFKGRRFQAPKKIPARPTTDFAKESLFNILAQEINWEATHFLDLYSGIGNIGLEAISRGAENVTMVDQNAAAIRWIKDVLQTLDEEGHDVIRAETLKWLKSTPQSFDVVFADPPYDYPQYDELIKETLERKLKNEGLFILEHRQNISFEEHSQYDRDRTYGEVKFTFFRS